MVQPYTISVPDHRLAVIREKIARYDWEQLPDAGGWRSGVGKADLRRLCDYWLDRYDWRETERRVNGLPHFTADVEGERLHFVHVRGDGSKPPLLLLHGWPGSFLEFERLIGPLAADGHDVVVPSLPGFAFSNPITGIIGPRRAAALMHRLMAELFGGARYLVQGGDWGAHIGCWMAQQHPDALVGLHVNMLEVVAEDTLPSTGAEKDWWNRRKAILKQETGYSSEQGTRPQTLGVAMADSPAGAAGWIMEKFGIWADLPRREDGSPDVWSRFSEAQLLDNIMLYVAPSSVVTATWIYQGERLEQAARFPAGTRITVPTGVAAFPDPVFLPPPRSYVEKTYGVVHWTEMASGGHFAALEQPDALLADLRGFIATVTGQ